MNDVLRFIGITKDARTAGPGKRLELFTKGCIRGVVSPCEGCFNKITWSFEGKFKQMTMDEVVGIIDRDAWNRQVTFCGGEPILQARALGEVAKRLKKKDPSFHFVMYTMYKLDVLMEHGLDFTWRKRQHEMEMLDQLKDYAASYEVKEADEEGNPLRVKFNILTPEDVKEVMRYIDLIVDGEYQHDKRLTIAEYMHDGGFIGSANQRVINAPLTICAQDFMEECGVNQKGPFIYQYADEYMNEFNSNAHCQACGHIVDFDKDYCNERCENRHIQRIKEMRLLSKTGSK